MVDHVSQHSQTIYAVVKHGKLPMMTIYSRGYSGDPYRTQVKVKLLCVRIGLYPDRPDAKTSAQVNSVNKHLSAQTPPNESR